MDNIDCIVVGAGVVGLAIARALARRGREVLVLEAESGIGSGISSRNSEVIHAGLYYPPGSLMARFCVEGRHALYRFCEEHGVPHRRCGKLIVATSPDDDSRLAAIKARAEANDVNDLSDIDRRAAAALEPHLNCSAALLSPSTGIVDAHAFMLALRGDAEDAGALFAFHAPMQDAAAAAGGFIVSVGGGEPMKLTCQTLINAAGLQASEVAGTIDALAREHIPRTYYAKGNYFSCSVRAPFSRLIYPVPEPGGLGVHLTLDLAGAARFGPDVEWIERAGYDVDPGRADRFYPAIRRYWPDLPDNALQPAYSGIRPKIVPPEIAVQDFMIEDERQHGVRGLINLFGIESPGLTSALAIGDHVGSLADMID